MNILTIFSDEQRQLLLRLRVQLIEKTRYTPFYKLHKEKDVQAMINRAGKLAVTIPDQELRSTTEQLLNTLTQEQRLQIGDITVEFDSVDNIKGSTIS